MSDAKPARYVLGMMRLADPDEEGTPATMPDGMPSRVTAVTGIPGVYDEATALGMVQAHYPAVEGTESLVFAGEIVPAHASGPGNGDDAPRCTHCPEGDDPLTRPPVPPVRNRPGRLTRQGRMQADPGLRAYVGRVVEKFRLGRLSIEGARVVLSERLTDVETQKTVRRWIRDYEHIAPPGA